ncbi:LOW QUALITY PROTEIN: hypothetical protein Cgig2_010029 [Carnegiea gigantea]|uniref:Uncharacterized protein n=1 Tax=Carnegiea gigantea TaxID=171969 RepID=A0A9Q1K3S5_9CARY|nr:LOW QUALITY PROTEIN: hypothetical protein Cgig2_010029 [Carnegiea gigantea]
MWKLAMAGIYPVGFRNWAPVVEGPAATDHRWSKSLGLDGGLENCPLSRYKMRLLRMVAPSFISHIDLYWAFFSWLFLVPLAPRRWLNMLPTILSGISTGLLFPDFQALCPSYKLAVAEEAAWCFELPELPQAIFYAMLLNEAGRLGVLYGQMLHVIELTLTKLRWSTFESWVWLNGDRIFEARFWVKAEQKEESSRSRTLGRWPILGENPSFGAGGGPHARPVHFQMINLCPCFLSRDAERAALDFELPQMVQATFYAMLLNYALELGIVSGFLADYLKSTLEGLRWTSFEACIEQAVEYIRDNFRWALRESSALGPRPLPLDYHGLCPRFDLRVATQYAHDSNIPEIVQVIFYAMVIDNAAELGLSSRFTMVYVMWAMRKLD